MLPNTLEAWVYLIGACLVGFVLGQWIRSRGNKDRAINDAASQLKREIAYADKLAKKKKKGNGT